MSGDKSWREWGALDDWPLDEETGVETDLEHMDTYGTASMTALGIADLGDYDV